MIVPYHHKHAMKESNSQPDTGELTPSMYALSNGTYGQSSIPAACRRTYLRVQRHSAIERSGERGYGHMLLLQLAVYCDLDERVKKVITPKVLGYIGQQYMPPLHKITEYILREADEVEKQLGIFVPGSLATKADTDAYIIYEQVMNGTHEISADIRELLCDDCKFARCMHPKCGKDRPYKMDAPTLRSTPSAKIGIPNPEQIRTKSYHKLYKDLQDGNHRAYVIASDFWRILQTGDPLASNDYLNMIQNGETPTEWIAAFKQLRLWHMSRQSHIDLTQQMLKEKRPAKKISPPPEQPRSKNENDITQPEIPMSKYPSRMPSPRKATPQKPKGDIVSPKPRRDQVIDIRSLIVEGPKK